MANLIENPGFEADTSSPPGKWANFNSPSNITRDVSTTVSYAGGQSWHVTTTDGATADCGINQTEFSGRTGTIAVTPNTAYYYSSRVKTVLTTGQVHTHIKLFAPGYSDEGGEDTADVTGTTDWVLNDKTFTTGASHTIAEVWLCFGAFGSSANGEAWFDEISLDIAGSAVISGVLGVGIIPTYR